MFLIVLLPLLLVVISDANAQSLQSGSQLYDYRCVQPNGYESVARQCDLYVECQDNKAYQSSCPDGLHFNSKAVWPNYPCGYPSEVKCSESDAVQEAQPTAECSHLYGYFRLSTGECDSYKLCHAGIATIMNCDFGLVFNSEKAVCDWPGNVPECNHSRQLEGFVCPVPLALDGFTYNFRYGKSCRHFVACTDGYPRLLSCAEDQSFDENSQTCVDAQHVADCDPSS